MSTNQEAFPAELLEVPGFLFVDHVAISVPRGQLDAQVSAYKMLGFRELHREEVYGTDQVRESLLQVGDSQNLIQLLEPLTEDSPVQKAIDKAGGRGGLAHVAFRVKSAGAAFNYLKEKGFKIIDAAPRPVREAPRCSFSIPSPVRIPPSVCSLNVSRTPVRVQRKPTSGDSRRQWRRSLRAERQYQHE